MKQVFLSGKGEVALLDAPVPGRLPGSVLVRTAWSVISSGTEGAAVSRRGGILGVIEKAARQRDKIEKVWRAARTQGLASTLELVRGRLEDYTPMGYSCAGQVVEVDGAEDEFAPGDWVACMGAGYASHAEYVTVPRNLAAKIPDGVAPEHAAFAALACIAQQGVRVAAVTPGESILVIGLGLIGTLAAQTARAMGYQVFATDLAAGRVEFARERLGIAAWTLGEVDVLSEVRRATDGHGVDAAVVCAAADSSAPLDLACDAVRRKGRVAIVGDLPLKLERARIYRKEVTVQISTSYGPGRYDPDYEEGGQDYPRGYVRWTEKRNLQFFLHLLQEKSLALEPMISARFPVDQAVSAYAHLKSAPGLYGVLLRYNDAERTVAPARTIALAAAPRRVSGKIGLGLIGAGAFAKGVHLPNLARMGDRFQVRAVATRSGATAAAVARRFGIPVASSDVRAVLDDAAIDAVLISTRHASHGALTLQALEAGKHVFVEKPMCLTVEEGEQICELAARRGLVVRVGFNRRFAPLLRRMREEVGRQGQRMFTCRVNLGALGEHWSQADQEGGRFLGEGVHFVDLCNWFIGSEPRSTVARYAGAAVATNPNVVLTLDYADGSVGSITYAALGSAGAGKERFEAFGNGVTAAMEDYRWVEVNGRRLRTGGAERHDKGQRGELAEFHRAVTGAGADGGADATAGLVATRIIIDALAASRGEAAADLAGRRNAT